MLFSEEEYLEILGLLDKDDPNLEENAIALIKWAEKIKVGQSLLDLSLKGLLKIVMENGEPKFTATEEGQEIASEATNRAFEEIISNFEEE